ncbi:MAG: FtsW/RodA/SpoVE family cell cycle protein [candidate division WOR-3 bacterium]
MPSKEYKYIYISLIICFLLILFGIFMIYSSSFYQIAFLNKFEFDVFKSLFTRIISGVAGFILFFKIPKKFWQKYSFINLLICFILLISVLLFGQRIQGAKRWIDLKFIQFQPFEIFKPLYIAYISAFFYKYGKELFFTKKLYYIITVSLVFFLLVALEPNFSSAISIIFVLTLLLFIKGLPLLKIFRLSLIMAIFSLFIIIAGKRSFSSHLIERVQREFKEKREYEQVTQAKIAIASGSFFGKGIGKGEAKYLYLPEIKKDFIFSLICEEFGVLGAAFLIFLYTALIISLLKVSFKTSDQFLSTYTAGFAIFIFYYVAVHIGVNMGILPPAGLPLPFISFGGSSLLSNFIFLGIILRALKDKEENFEERGFEKVVIL